MALSLRTPPEIPIYEVSFALPDPAPAPVTPETTDQMQAATPAASEPEPRAEAEPQMVTVAPAAEIAPAPAPRPMPKPRRPDPAPAATAPAPPPSIAEMLAALPPAPAATAVTPAPQPAAPVIPPMQLYAARLRNLLAEYQTYPHAARQRRQEGVARIALTIDRAGQLTALRLYESSSVSVLDDAALAMARRAAPFPPPPLEPQQMQAVFIVPVGFALED